MLPHLGKSLFIYPCLKESEQTLSAKKTSDEQLSVMLLFSQAWDIGGAKTHIETLVQQLR